jgi:pimeloyl-ACP methyl ester carboxylesterase
MPDQAYIHAIIHLPDRQSQTPSIVFIHGAAGNYTFWPPELRRLPGHAIYAVDLPGHGRLTGPGLPSIAEYATALSGWRDSIQLNDIILVGHSMGSAIAMMMAIEQPERVSRLVLIGSSAHFQVNPTLLEQAKDPQTFPKAVERIVRWSFAPVTSSRLLELAARRMLEVDPAVLYGDLLACQEFDIADRIHKITSPTLILCGQDDRMTPLSHSQALASQINGAHLEIIPEAGHMAMLEQPGIVKKAILDFANQAC